MKKKILSLLLVVAMLVSVVSVGLGTITVSATPAGAGIESINAFSLTPGTQSYVANGSNIATTVTVKSLVKGYDLQVKSITATLPYASGASAKVSVAAGSVVSTAGGTFHVTGTIPAGTSSVIRYECLYDLIDTATKEIVYSDMTGYGYGYVSHSVVSGGVGTKGKFNDLDNDDDHSWKSRDDLYAEYVQPAGVTLYYNTYTAGWWHTAQTATPTVSGNAPASLVVSGISWNSTDISSSSKSGTWLSWGALTTGFYQFTVSYDKSLGSQSTNIYYLDPADKVTTLNAVKPYLAANLEKSYYSTATWNEYIAAMDEAYNIGLSQPYNSYGFQVACQTATTVKTGARLQNAYNALVEVGADYSAAAAAADAFNAKKAETFAVTTYNPSGATGTLNVNKYNSSDIEAVENYINSCDLTLKKSDQKTVDGYTATITSMTNAMSTVGAYYAELDEAVADFNNYDDSLFTVASFVNFNNVYFEAESCYRSYTYLDQPTINSIVQRFTEKRDALVFLSADYTQFNENMEIADMIVEKYENGELLTTAAEFPAVWENFQNAYNAAKEKEGLDIRYQAEVDEASDNLANAMGIVYEFTPIDVTELNKAVALKPAYAESYYETGSYTNWKNIRQEALMFVVYAQNNMKTMADLDEMNQIKEALVAAYNNLEYIKADFTNIYAALELVPTEEVLNYYVDEVVDPLRALLAQVDYGATFLEQEAVDQLAADIVAAVGELTEENYKDADYAIVEEAIARANSLTRSNYEDFLAVDEAIEAVEYDRKIVKQDEVDSMAKAINDAIDNLVPVPADYEIVNTAIENANAVEHPEWYRNYDKVTSAIEAVDWTKNIFEQAEVNAMAEAINAAVGALELDDADYSGVIAAIDSQAALGNLEDYTDESLDRLDDAVGSVVTGYTKDRQDEVDAMEKAILDAIAAMELLPANYDNVNAAIIAADQVARVNYRDLTGLDNAIAAVDRTKNIRQQEEVEAMAQAILAAIGELELKPANYDALNTAIAEAKAKVENSEYPYTEESKDMLQAVIDSINWELDILEQEQVDGYLAEVTAASEGLTYIDADYASVNEALEKAQNLDRTLYVTMEEVDTAVLAVETGYKIDRQPEVDLMAEAINTAIRNLVYAPADYTAVDNAVESYEALNRTYYEETDLAAVDEIKDMIEYGYTRERQAEVDLMATSLVNALRVLDSKMKEADTTELNKAVENAYNTIDAMYATGYEIEETTLEALYVLIDEASVYEGARMDSQEEIDALTDAIYFATDDLEYVFTINEDESGVIFEGEYVYGLTEGMTPEEVEKEITYVGYAEMVFEAGKDGFGTGSVIKFLDRNGEVIAEYTVIVFADANGDGYIDMFDVTYATELSNYGIEASEAQIKALDLNLDTVVDSFDVAILISLANMETTVSQDGLCTVA